MIVGLNPIAVDKISKGMATEFDSQLMCDSKSLNTKIKSYDSKINTGGPGKKIPKQGSQYVCLSIIVLDSVSQINHGLPPF